ncbi:MAG: CBS domain-containing protein [Polyangiaceae bacterium]
MLVKDLMRHDVRTCMPHDKLSEAARIMWDGDIGAVPVVDYRKCPIAMLTDRDVCMAAYITGLPLSLIPVSQAMSKHLVTCEPDATVHDVELLMQSAQVRRIPVVDYVGTLVGIITLGDLAADARSLRMAVAGPGVVKTLASINERRWHGALTES